MPDRITENIVAYIAAEASFGVKPSTGAFRDLALMNIERNPVLDMKTFQGQGRRFASKTRSNKDYIDGKASGDATYTELIYPFNGHWGSVTATPVASSTATFDWIWPIKLSGAVTPASFWMQYGDAIHADEWGATVFSGTTLKSTREGVTFESPFFGQAMQDNITLVTTPTQLNTTPMVGKHWQVTRDPSSGSFGATVLTRAVDAEIAYTGAFTPWFASNRASATYTVPVDRKVKAQFTVTMEADSAGLTSLSDARQGNIEYFRYSAVGDATEDQVTLTVTGTPSGGSFTLTINGQTTGTIAYNATASAVQTAIQALPGVGTRATVSGGPGPGTPWVVTFTGDLALGPVIAHTDSFTGGTSPALTVSAGTFFSHSLTADIACSLAGDLKHGDSDGIYAVTYIFNLVEDLNWGNAGLVTVRNGRSAL